jgi:hypothetical protein
MGCKRRGKEKDGLPRVSKREGKERLLVRKGNGSVECVATEMRNEQCVLNIYILTAPV